MLKELSSSASQYAEIVISNVINKSLSILKKVKIQWGIGIVSSQMVEAGWIGL